MGDILKEAIADAKAVRETALANAKMALEEAFTPQLKNMLSAKLKEDEFTDEEPIVAPEEDEELGMDMGAEVPVEEPVVAPEETDDMGMDMAAEVPAEEGDYMEDDMMGAEEVPVEEPVIAPEIPAEEAEIDIEDDNLDLESIIRELEAELGDEEEVPVAEQDDAYDQKADSTDSSHLAEQDDAYDENDPGEKAEHVGGSMDGVPALKKEQAGEDEEIEVDESLFIEQDEEGNPIDTGDELEENNDVSSGIGTGDNKNPATYANKASTEDPGNSTDVEDMDGVAALKKENREYKAAVHFLKDKLHEVNILNAKLLFTNKLFKEFALNNNQKLKVVETFDRTQSTREIKLVYSTLAEQFSDNGSIYRKKSINESASSSIGSTKPSVKSRKVITEESSVANRFKKLAGIIK